MNRIGKSAEGIIAYHGTDKTGFAAFEVAAAGPYNVGLHFGTRKMAQVLAWQFVIRIISDER